MILPPDTAPHDIFLARSLARSNNQVNQLFPIYRYVKSFDKLILRPPCLDVAIFACRVNHMSLIEETKRPHNLISMRAG